jgi:hypothetical protein
VQAVEPVLAVGVGAELAAQVVGGLVVRVLEVVLAVGQMSKTALGMGLPVVMSRITPCILVTRPPAGTPSWKMTSPCSRKGALGDQKGPRIEDEVGSMPVSETILWAISSTRLGWLSE